MSPVGRSLLLLDEGRSSVCVWCVGVGAEASTRTGSLLRYRREYAGTMATDIWGCVRLFESVGGCLTFCSWSKCGCVCLCKDDVLYVLRQSQYCTLPSLVRSVCTYQSACRSFFCSTIQSEALIHALNICFFANFIQLSMVMSLCRNCSSDCSLLYTPRLPTPCLHPAGGRVCRLNILLKSRCSSMTLQVHT